MRCWNCGVVGLISEEMIKKIKEDETFMEVINRRQKNWLAPILESSGILKTVLHC